MTIFIMVYGISSLLIMGAAEEREHHALLAVSRGRDAARNEAELLGIRSSLNPHFLFNSLNVIKALASENPKKAGEAVVSLSEILRTSLRATAHTTVPLSEELKLIRSYLDLQKMRMEELLAVDIREDEGLTGFPVPPMVLHQLVENAVKHSPAGPVRIGIDICQDGEGLRFLVRNPGHSQSHQAGIGLDAIRAQLRALYGEKSHFGIVDDGQGEIVAEIRIPRMSCEESRSSSPPSGL
jgi:LytS/YehU family sensor histidine kinase